MRKYLLRYALHTIMIAVVSLVGMKGWGQVTLPHYEPFDYAAGQSLQSQAGWTALFTGDNLAISSGSLTYSDLVPSLGNKVTFDGGGIDAAKAITSQTSGTIYYSFLLKITSLGSLNTTGGYFTGFNEGTGTNYGGTVWIRSDGTGYNIGISSRPTAGTIWSTGTTPLNTTLLVTISYQFISGPSNDLVKLWINPTPGQLETAATLEAVNSGTDLTNISRILIRQDAPTSTPFIEMDELRIANSWSGVTPVSDYFSDFNVSTSSATNWKYNNGTGLVDALNPPSATNNITVSSFHNLTVDNDFTIGAGKTLNLSSNSMLTVQPTASLTIAGTANLNNQFVTLRSDPSGTARLGEVSGTLNGATYVTIERHIPSAGNRAWRLLSAPLSPTGAPSLYSSWQENGNNLGGYGTHITKPSASGGYDASTIAASASIAYYNGSTLVAPPNTNATAVTDHGAAWFLFVRGDRSINVNDLVETKSTTIRMTGTLKHGNTTVGVPGASFSLIPNPYPSPVSFETIYDADNSVGNTFYVWDATLNEFGAYRTITRIGDDDYISTPPPSSNEDNMRNIMSGQAFFLPGNKTVAFAESMKTAALPPVNPFRTGPGTEQMLINLNVMLEGTPVLADGIRARYSNSFVNQVDASDVVKLDNFNENIGIVRNNDLLAVESRDLIDQSDTIFLKLWNVRTKSYTLEFLPSDFDLAANIEAYLIDAYLQTTVPVSLTTATSYPFNVTVNTASAASNRFMVIYKKTGILPVKFVNVKAVEKEQKVKVDWQVAPGNNIRNFEVERSYDGINFSSIAVFGNDLSNSFVCTDAAPYQGNNYYRVKATEVNGLTDYSKTVKVRIGSSPSGFEVYPNPATDNTINVQFIQQPKGKYILRLLNEAGQQLNQTSIIHEGGSMGQAFLIPHSVSPGVYLLQIIGDMQSATRPIILK